MDGETHPHMRGFWSAYSTNIGAERFNRPMREGARDFFVLDDGKIIKEIKRTHGGNVFDRGGSDDLNDIKNNGMGYFSEDTINNIKFSLYNPRQGVRSFYRGQDLSLAAVNQYKTLVGKEDCVHSLSFLSVSSEQAFAETFMKAKPDTYRVLFNISGFSATPNRGHYAPKNEKESVFSPYADFRVDKVTSDPGAPGGKVYFIYLIEVKGFAGKSQAMFY